MTEGCKTAGPHFNPFGKTHGGPGKQIRHEGDLGNVIANEEGVACNVIEDECVMIYGKHTVCGRSFVVHAKNDDLGEGGDEESLKTGNAGGRQACGVIGISNEISW